MLKIKIIIPIIIINMSWLKSMSPNAIMELGLGVSNTIINARQAKKNREAQVWENEKNRSNQERWNLQNRQWALDDRDTTNAYNAPKQQMQRMKEAGLNPHLIYGNGVQAQGEAPRATPPDTSDQPAVHYENNFLNPLQEAMAIVIQTDNMRAQKDLLEAQKELALRNIPKVETETALKNWQMNRSKSLYDLDKQTLESKLVLNRQELKNKQANEAFTLQQKEIAYLDYKLRKSMNEKQIQKIMVDMATSKLQQAKTEQETIQLQEAIKKLKDDTEFSIMLHKAGITPGGGAVQNAASLAAKFWNNLFN